jgi:hypothetical protein
MWWHGSRHIDKQVCSHNGSRVRSGSDRLRGCEWTRINVGRWRNQKRKSKLNHEGHDPRREFTAEALRARSTEFLIKKYSDLCELGVSAVN